MDCVVHDHSSNQANLCFHNQESLQLWSGGMDKSIQDLNIYHVCSKSLTHCDETIHHYTETPQAYVAAGIDSMKSHLDRFASFAAFSSHTPSRDLTKITDALDSQTALPSGDSSNLLYPTTMILDVIRSNHGTSLSSRENSARQNVSDDVSFSFVCISDKEDRVQRYPLSERILSDTHSDAFLNFATLVIRGNHDSGRNSLMRHSAMSAPHNSRNVGERADALSPEKGIYFYCH